MNTPQTEDFAGRMVPGAAAADAPVRLADGRSAWLLRQMGRDFTALVYADRNGDALAAEIRAAAAGIAAIDVLRIVAAEDEGGSALVDAEGLVARRYDLQPGTVVLLRPDQHVCARWRKPGMDAVRAALQRAIARG